ncbi:MAG: S8 family serine peptidase [Sedimentisphaerales bacterium]|nr:S8 family serine peptidase [Sedimentisphaerales bacterium]
MSLIHACPVFSRSGSPQRATFSCDREKIAVWLLASCLFLGRQASGALLMPPARPSVAPVIRDTYASDVDGNGIDDRLEARAEESVMTGLRSASVGGSIPVELIFGAPVTQAQIDAFLALGGEITYLYRAVSYGWNGRIGPDAVRQLPAVMGPSLIHVTGCEKMGWYMDLASQSGRVRPVWRPGFAGNLDGFDGDPDTTIAFIDTGVDGAHRDLTGRCVYWSDLTRPPSAVTVDRIGHGTLVTGVAVGTGDAGGSADAQLTWTFGYDRPVYGYISDPITLPPGTYELSSGASWSGAYAWLDHVVWGKGGPPDSGTYVGRYSLGRSSLHLTNVFVSYGTSCYAAILVDVSGVPLRDIAVVNRVTPYPCVGDGFNTFRGVAPQCRWAAVRIPGDVHTEEEFENAFAVGLDDLVANRLDKRIKIINISGGLIDVDGFAKESIPFRDKINSAVRNGVVVVVAAGNRGDSISDADLACGDPVRAALALCVGASNDQNALTAYSSPGFLAPQAGAGEDFKPDLIAPGGSRYYSAMMSVDTGAADGAGVDQNPNDYACAVGTSFSSPFVAGCAALVIEAMERNGTEWDFTCDEHPRFVKMLLCATASETNAKRETSYLNPSLQRSAEGPEGFPAGKDRCEGYGLINADAAVEAISLTYAAGTRVREEFGNAPGDRRIWARTMHLAAGRDIDLSLANPATGDFDLYLYSMTPSTTGTPVILASSTAGELGAGESVHYSPNTDMSVLVVVKRVSGSGEFELGSVQAGPPFALEVAAAGWIDVPLTIALDAVDDGLPQPPGQLSHVIASLPKHGRLRRADNGASITTVPTTLSAGASEVIYVPNLGWVGQDSFRYYASDGGTAPLGGTSNAANVLIDIVSQITLSYRVAAGDDDAHCMKSGTLQTLNGSTLLFGSYMAGMRFCNVDVPPGAQVKSAVLRVKSARSYSGMMGVGAIRPPIYVEATADAGPFNNSGRRVNNLTKTNASVIWDLAKAQWEKDIWYESPDIGSVIQEVIDQSDWSAGNALVVVCGVDTSTSSNREVWSYDDDPAHAPQLQITYGR